MGDAETIGDRYVVDGPLGEGGMGRVFRVRHRQLGKPFALKLIAPAFAGDVEARNRFNQEAQLASSISHPNIVSVVDYGEDQRFGAYMVMELIDGQPLFASSAGPMTVRRACDVLCQITDALEHIHRRGIIHGDIKADNILTVSENLGARRRHVVKLLDFGLARRSDAGGEDMVSGSPHYLAPERATGGAPSVGADIYALGVLGYVLLAGSVPFDGEVMEILMAQVQVEPEPLSRRRGEELDDRLESLIMRAMAKHPADRHRDAAAFRYELNAAMDMLDLGRRRSAPLPRISQPIPAVDDSRERAIVSAFERSKMPQALISAAGLIVASNKAFAKLLGLKDTGADGHDLTRSSLADTVSGLMREIRKVHVEGKAHERRAVVHRGDGKPPFTLVLWIAPTKDTGDAELHLIVRIEGA